MESEEVQVKNLRIKTPSGKKLFIDDVITEPADNGLIELQELNSTKPDSSTIIDIHKPIRALLAEKEKEENVRLWMVSNCADIVEALELFETPSFVDELKDNENVLVIKVTVDEDFADLNSRELKDLIKKCRLKSVLILLVSKTSQKFSLFWKTKEIETFLELKPYDEKFSGDQKVVYEFVAEFLKNSLKNGHLGLHSSYKYNKNSSKIEIHMLANSKDYNLVLLAAQAGNTEAAKIFLNSGISAYNSDSSINAQSLALALGHHEVVLMLLQSNLPYPDFISVNKCPPELKKFIETALALHKAIRAGDGEKVDEILKEKHSRHYFNLCNESAPKVAIENNKIDMYEKLLVNKVLFGPNENVTEIMGSLNFNDRKNIREIHLKHSIDMPEKHINTLVANSYVGHEEVSNVEDKLDHIRNAFKILNENPFIRIILMIVAAAKKFRIIFDFNRDSVEFVDPTADSSTAQVAGLFYLSGRIYIGAKQLLNKTTQNHALATMAHELCHFAMELVFKNTAKPYTNKDNLLMQEVYNVSELCKEKSGKEDIVDMVYECYPEDMHHAEMIVRVPHLMAFYADNPEKMGQSRETFDGLYNLYEKKIVPEMQKALPEIEARVDKEMARKDKEILKLRRILFGLFVLFVVTVGCLLFLTPEKETKSYDFNDLNKQQQQMIWDYEVTYANTSVRFGNVLKENSTTFGHLGSGFFKNILNKNITVDLNSQEFKHLEQQIDFSWDSLTEPLKYKFLNSTCDFQGVEVPLSDFHKIYNETFEYLTSENIKQVLINGSISIGQGILDVPKFCVNRTFNKLKTSEMPRNYLKSSSPIGYNELLSNIATKGTFILSDDPGTGKTVVFKNLAQDIKSAHPLKWVTYVEASKVHSNYDKCHIIDELFGIRSTFEKAVFFKASYTKNMVILFDGYENFGGVFDLTKTLKNYHNSSGNALMFSMRPNQNHLEKIFDSPSYSLNQLDKTDQMNFIKCQVELTNGNANDTAILQVQNIIKHLQDKSRGSPLASDFTTPLMLKLIADEKVLENDKAVEVKTEKSYNLFEFYKRLIETLIVRWKDMRSSDELVLEILTGDTNLLKIFQKKGLEYEKSLLIDPVHLKMSNLGIFKYEGKKPQYHRSKSLLQDIGIFLRDKNEQFAYRTLTEYFIAKYLIDYIYDSTDCAYNDDEIELRLDLFFYFVRTYGHHQWLVMEFMNDYLDKSTNRGTFCENVKNIIMTKYKNAVVDLLSTDHPEIFKFLFNFFSKDRDISKVLYKLDEPESFFKAIFNPVYNAFYMDANRIVQLFEITAQFLTFDESNNFFAFKELSPAHVGVYYYKTTRIPMNQDQKIYQDACDYYADQSILFNETDWNGFIDSPASSIILIDAMIVKSTYTRMQRDLSEEQLIPKVENDETGSGDKEEPEVNDSSFNISTSNCPVIETFWAKIKARPIENIEIFLLDEILNFITLSASNSHFQNPEILNILLEKSEELLQSSTIAKFFNDSYLLHRAAESSISFKLIWSYFLKHVTNVDDQKKILQSDSPGMYKYENYVMYGSNNITYKNRYFEKTLFKPLHIALLSSNDTKYLEFVMEAHKSVLSTQEIVDILKSSVDFAYEFISFSNQSFCESLAKYFKTDFESIFDGYTYQFFDYGRKYPNVLDILEEDNERLHCAQMLGLPSSYVQFRTISQSYSLSFLDLFCKNDLIKKQPSKVIIEQKKDENSDKLVPISWQFDELDAFIDTYNETSNEDEKDIFAD